MNSNEAAARVGCTTKDLRRFLRDDSSTYLAVGSGARYEFTERDIPELTRRFNVWAANRAAVRARAAENPAEARSDAGGTPTPDAPVWDADDDLAPLVPILRLTPRERRAILDAARAQERRLLDQLAAAGMALRPRAELVAA